MSLDVNIVNDHYVNGKFTAPPFDNNPPWLHTYMKHNLLQILPFGEVGALWIAHTQSGIKVGQRGDRIMNDLMFGLVLEKQAGNTLTWDQVKPKDAPAPPAQEAKQTARVASEPSLDYENFDDVAPLVTPLVPAEAAPSPKRGRGRPPGAKNKPKAGMY